MPAPKKAFPRFNGWSLVRPHVQRHLDKLTFPKPADGPEREDFLHVCYLMAVRPRLLHDRHPLHPDVSSFTRYFAEYPDALLATVTLIRQLFRDLEGGSTEMRVRLWLLEHKIVMVKGQPVNVFTLERKSIRSMMQIRISDDTLNVYINRFRRFLAS